MTEKYEVLRIWSEALYDHQEVRISSLNRVRALIRRKLLELGFLKEEKKTADSETEQSWTDEELKDAMLKASEKKKLTKADYDFLMDSFNLANAETSIEQVYDKKIKPLINDEDIWKQWLVYVNGISYRNACRLLRHYGYCEKFDTISKLWAYSGLAPVDGKAVKRKKGEQLPYNMKIKTSVLGVIGDCLIKTSGKYKKQIYDVYKARILERGCCDNPKCKGKPGHAHNMARRKMVKIFLSHYWLMCRTIKGLPTRDPFPLEHGHTTFIKPFFDKEPTAI